MPSKLRSLRLLLAAALLAACNSVPTKTFRFDAVDGEEHPLPAMVVVGEDWVGAAERKQFVNVEHKDDVLSLPVVFDRGEVEITVVALPVDPDSGKPTRIPRSRSDPSDYVSDTNDNNNPRRLRPGDPVLQLFMLTRR